MIRYIDLFAGSGGWDVGIEPLGWNCEGLYELNEIACETLRFNFPHINVNQFNLKNFDKINFPNVDIIIGSPPCQGFSNEGKKNKDDKRNNLVQVFVDIVKKLNPDVWLFENVPGFQRLYGGYYFEKFSQEFNESNYEWDSFILNSSDYGVPQNRKRFISIGSKNKKPRRPIPTHRNNPDFFHSKKKVTLWEAISDLPNVENGERDGVFDYEIEPSCEYQQYSREGSIKVFNHTTQKHSDRVLEKIKAVPNGGDMKNLVGKYPENKTNYAGGYRRAKKDEPSYTAYWTRGMTSIHPIQNRFLSPRECARIQSYPDSFVFKGPTIPQYTQICNAVPPLFSKAICSSIQNTFFKEKINYQKQKVIAGKDKLEGTLNTISPVT